MSSEESNKTSPKTPSQDSHFDIDDMMQQFLMQKTSTMMTWQEDDEKQRQHHKTHRRTINSIEWHSSTDNCSKFYGS